MATPQEVTACLEDLATHYSDYYEENGRGANGHLWFARNRISQADVAIKFYYGEPGERRHDEPRLLSAINSPNVLPILDARNVSEEWAYFITPRCQGGDLDDLMETRLGVYEAIDVVLGIGRGMSDIHAAGMVHRDLKPANIVMDQGAPRIADFGTVRLLNDGATYTSASQHSILYRPPEVFTSKQYSRRGDVYQLGLVAYQVLGGFLPYDGRAYLSPRERKQYASIPDQIDQSIFIDQVIQRRAEDGDLIDLSSLPPWISMSAKRTLRQMTHPDPDQRLASMADVAATMSKARGGSL